MHRRVEDLINRFSECLDAFDQGETFVGPSVYFHLKTIGLRQRAENAMSLLQLEPFFDLLYATLTAWGLHRMGPGNTKLRGIDELSESFRLQASAIQALWSRSLIDLPTSEVDVIAGQLWAILHGLRVSVARAQIVANSKALHHVLPALMPPIDREYTYTFFYNRTMLSVQEDRAFDEIFKRFHLIAHACAPQIKARVGKGFHSSESKVVDNAIVGYVKTFLPEPDVAGS
jgi:hypothetical protein